MAEKGKIWNLLKGFWCNNFKKNYKKVSIGLGTILILILGTIIGLFERLIENSGIDSYTSGLLIAMLVGIEASLIVFIFLIFGKPNGNGGTNGDSEKSDGATFIADLVKKDTELREVVTRKFAEIISKALEGEEE